VQGVAQGAMQSPSTPQLSTGDVSTPDSSIKMNARQKFASFQLKVPQDWHDPTGNTAPGQYRDAFTAQQRSTTPDKCVPPLSMPQSSNFFWVGVQKMHNATQGSYLDGICGAISFAWSQWQSLATMAGVLINGPTASAGTLVGPPLTPLILAKGPKKTPMELKYTTVIANVIGTAWLTFTQSVKVPGLPWYPAFAAVPSPVGPPMPNIPVPFAALTQVPVSISTNVTKQQMVGQLADPRAPLHKELFESVAFAFEMAYNMWKVTTMVTNVIGTGPVPSFAPPVVPVGPVVGGVGTMGPGGLTGVIA
jgi:hypothetical protein